MPRFATVPDTTARYEVIPQQFVHKLDPDEVLLTGWRKTGPDTYEVTARRPQAHSFYLSGNGGYDPLLFAETVRQLLPLLSHAAYGVPLGHQLIWDDFTYSLDAAAMDAAGAAIPVRLVVHCTAVTRRSSRASAIVLHAEAYQGSRRLGEARTRFTVHSPAVYQRLRGAYGDAQRAMANAVLPEMPLPARRVGRVSPYDVVLSPDAATGRWQLCVDTGHPVLFDHPVDHVPGMLLLEAARQATQAMADPLPVVPVTMHTEFYRYIELDAPCWVEVEALPADPSGRCRVRVSMRQHETVCCVADVSVERAPGSFPLPVLASREAAAPALV
ncbi:ScbA/BarX family gamma-butyrolactone biosynthesis protein [Streptomyces purpurogeneiscleroticus]|uniref:ScbA/BarX family gamma-butyrolactone biosynthesis protein n=1 Tax=Streptomyces purpurogeneiscleroticus TaxID=68259 RepID=UPI001CBB827A|nr:ScbA/BarX family gamma-butyrolactone biosynthesis protein [Streptomyces purpurogeneiscleroticus]